LLAREKGKKWIVIRFEKKCDKLKTIYIFYINNK
jgi:hypothetical protein